MYSYRNEGRQRRMTTKQSMVLHCIQSLSSTADFHFVRRTMNDVDLVDNSSLLQLSAINNHRHRSEALPLIRRSLSM
jgi:hypothetical protein